MRRIDYLNEKYIKEFAPKIREEDRREIYSSDGITDAESALMISMKLSVESWVWLVDEKPVVVFGVSPGSYLTRHGLPWLMATNELKYNQYAFIHNAKLIIEYWKTRWDYLSNYVDNRNTCSIKWLKSLGFTLDEPIPFGYEGLPFHRFYMRGNV